MSRDYIGSTDSQLSTKKTFHLSGISFRSGKGNREELHRILVRVSATVSVSHPAAINAKCEAPWLRPHPPVKIANTQRREIRFIADWRELITRRYSVEEPANAVDRRRLGRGLKFMLVVIRFAFLLTPKSLLTMRESSWLSTEKQSCFETSKHGVSSYE